MTSARDRIAERVKNAYASGYNDGRCDRLDRMDEVADAETAKILGLVREVLLSEAAKTALLVHGPHIPSVLGRQMYGKDAEMILEQVIAAAFGADDDGGER